MKEKSIPQLLNEVIENAQKIQKEALNSLYPKRETPDHDCKMDTKGFCEVCFPYSEEHETA